mgnify:FL=1
MSFDKRWIEFEKQHGPQSPGAKEDALFWYKAGQSDVQPAFDALCHQIEDLKAELSDYKESPAS